MKLWAWVIGAVSAAIVAVVIYGWLTHEEAGLQYVCWNPSGTAGVRPLADPCGPKPLIWGKDRLPLLVGATGGSKGDLRDLQSAIRIVNGQLGELLRWAPGPPLDVAVHFGMGAGADADEVARTIHKRVEGKLLADVMVRNVPPGQLLPTLVHECGHVVGLAHDTFGAMEQGSTSTRFTDHDSELLQNLYSR